MFIPVAQQEHVSAKQRQKRLDDFPPYPASLRYQGQEKGDTLLMELPRQTLFLAGLCVHHPPPARAPLAACGFEERFGIKRWLGRQDRHELYQAKETPAGMSDLFSSDEGQNHDLFLYYRSRMNDW
jgi:hypothetical protein